MCKEERSAPRKVSSHGKDGQAENSMKGNKGNERVGRETSFRGLMQKRAIRERSMLRTISYAC